MLRQRIITALVLVPVFVLGVIFLETTLLAMLLGLVIAMAAWEWAGIAGYSSNPGRFTYTVAIISLLLTAYLLRNSAFTQFMIIFVIGAWCGALWMVARYQVLGGSGFSLPLPASVIGVLVLVPPWISLVILHGDEPHGVKSVLFIMVLIWGADIAAYFAGRRWGRRKLCVNVSPGKSWEGVYGALLLGGFLGAAAALYSGMNWMQTLVFIVVCQLTIAASVLGDLLESLLKRISGIKDSGSILPGHGGILDRIDSLTAALPVFVFSTWLVDISL